MITVSLKDYIFIILSPKPSLNEDTECQNTGGNMAARKATPMEGILSPYK